MNLGQNKRKLIPGAVLFGLILLFGSYLRIESMLGTRVSYPLSGDAGQYFRYAYNLRVHHVYSKQWLNPTGKQFRSKSDAVRSPGFPLLIYFLIDARNGWNNLFKIMIFQVAISVLTIFIAFEFFKGFLPVYGALAASLLTAISPHLIVANSYVLTETPFCFLLVYAALLLNFLTTRPSGWLAGLAGAVVAFAVLVRPVLQYFPVIIMLWLLIGFGRKKGVQLFIAFSVGFALVFSPWIIRNLVVVKKISDDRLKINFLHHGMYPNFTYAGIKKSYGYPYNYDPHSTEINRSVSSVLAEIRRRFHNQPWRHLSWYLLKKPLVFWRWSILQGQGDVFIYPVTSTPYASKPVFLWTHRIMCLLHWPLVVLSFIGCLVAWFALGDYDPAVEKSLPIARFVALLMAYFTMIHMIGAPFPRYSVPLRPFVYSMAVYAIWRVAVYLRSIHSNASVTV